MIACLDVYYRESTAHAAAVILKGWESMEALAEYCATSPDVKDYTPGQLYLRELQPLLRVVECIDETIACYVVDAYCHLGADIAPGLGAYLHEALPAGASVIGVAKNRYRDTTHAVEVLRGGSVRPLFVTAIGMTYGAAAARIASMAGDFRQPSMLKRADRLSRDRTIGSQI